MDGHRESPAVTLTAFLLARYAEDEAAVATGRVAADLRDEPVQYLDYGEVQVSRRRFLADLEAKRGIVTRYLDVVRARDGGDRTEYAAEWIGLEAALSFLALPYADHEDYREEWRP